MPFYEKGDVHIPYEEAGSGFPLFLIPGGGLNSRISNWATAPFNAMEEFTHEYRCITMDLRHANGGQSSGPLEIDRPWDAYAADQLSLMDHLGIGEFLVMGFCIGGPSGGATSTRQADGRDTQLAHGKGLDDSDLPSEKAWLEHFPVDIILTF